MRAEVTLSGLLPESQSDWECTLPEPVHLLRSHGLWYEGCWCWPGLASGCGSVLSPPNVSQFLVGINLVLQRTHSESPRLRLRPWLVGWGLQSPRLALCLPWRLQSNIGHPTHRHFPVELFPSLAAILLAPRGLACHPNSRWPGKEGWCSHHPEEKQMQLADSVVRKACG